MAVTGRGSDQVPAFEVETARRLAEAGCPIAVIEPRVEPRVYLRDGHAITYWKYYEPLPAADTTATEYAQALERLHAGLRQLNSPAPHFTDRVGEAQAIVEDRSRSPDLDDANRELLTGLLRSLRRSILNRGAHEPLLHGEPHPGNVLRTTSGMRFIDLEACCYGPVEFDIAYAPEAVGDLYAPHSAMLRDCRILMLAMVAAWRADREDSFPNGREMLERLLAELRDADKRL
ncbi:MAG: phosphotransferase [Devosia sp.]